MSAYDLVSVNQPGTWNRVLARCQPFDSYHLPGYHLVAREHGEGEPYLFVFEDQDRCAAFPLLVNAVAQVDGLNDSAYSDATSVYGYPGPVSSVDPAEGGADEFRLRFLASLHKAMDDLGVVAMFSRQNPMIDSSWVLAPLAETVVEGPTVAIDLRQPEESRLRQFRDNHRRDIRRARRDGLVVRHDAGFEQIAAFGKLYEETMNLRGAADYYYFPEQYFTNLKKHLGDAVRLYVAERGEDVVSGALFLVCGGIIQYHLGGRAARFRECRGAIKLIFDEVSAWGAREGLSWLHLGGGLGSKKDSLFQFKAGFSKTHLQYRAFRLVFQPRAYRQLVRRREEWVRQNGLESPSDDFFPAYRRPAIYHARVARRSIDLRSLLRRDGAPSEDRPFPSEEPRELDRLTDPPDGIRSSARTVATCSVQADHRTEAVNSDVHSPEHGLPPARG